MCTRVPKIRLHCRLNAATLNFKMHCLHLIQNTAGNYKMLQLLLQNAQGITVSHIPANLQGTKIWRRLEIFAL